MIGVAYFDQIPREAFSAGYAGDEQNYIETTEFGQRLENLLGDNAQVYQLPDTIYPFAASSNAKLYAYTKTMKTSWPALSGEAIKHHKAINTGDAELFVKNLAICGYDGIWIHKGVDPGYLQSVHNLSVQQGMPDPLALLVQPESIEKLARIAGSPVESSLLGNFVFISIRPYRDRLEATYPQEELARLKQELQIGNPIVNDPIWKKPLIQFATSKSLTAPQ